MYNPLKACHIAEHAILFDKLEHYGSRDRHWIGQGVTFQAECNISMTAHWF